MIVLLIQTGSLCKHAPSLRTRLNRKWVSMFRVGQDDHKILCLPDIKTERVGFARQTKGQFEGGGGSARAESNDEKSVHGSSSSNLFLSFSGRKRSCARKGRGFSKRPGRGGRAERNERGTGGVWENERAPPEMRHEGQRKLRRKKATSSPSTSFIIIIIITIIITYYSYCHFLH